MRRVLYITGSRADYGPARCVLQAIHNAPDLDLYLLVTGMHLDSVHGETWKEIESDGFDIADRIYGRVTGDSLSAMVASIGLYLYGMSQAMARIQPDIVLVLGDRGEMLAGAMAAAFQNIPVVHLCGGAISGSIDDSIRHAITKFAHYHLPGFEEHAQRIIQMGESPDTVQVVGLPGGDLRADVTLSREQVCADYHLPNDLPYFLVVQHSVTQSQDQAEKQIVETLEALAQLPYPALLANPNDDAGGRVILKKMQAYAQKYSHLRILAPPRSRERFASVMANAGALIGNSSSALVEAMSVALPVVNIGERQGGREHLACWLNVPYDRVEISKAIDVALHDDDGYRAQLHAFRNKMIQRNTNEMVVARLRDLDLKIAHQPKVFWNSKTKA